MDQHAIRPAASMHMHTAPTRRPTGLSQAGRNGFGILDWIRLMLLRRRINAMLRRSVGPVRHEDVQNLPSYLLRDIGIQPPL